MLANNGIQDLLNDLLAGFRQASSVNNEPSLTTAYGWFYHWYNTKGGKRFSPDLSEQFVQHGAKNFYLYPKLTADLARKQSSVEAPQDPANAERTENLGQTPDAQRIAPWLFIPSHEGDETPVRGPRLYSLDAAAKECGIGREPMRRLGVELGLIREEKWCGMVLAFDGDVIQRLAKAMREGVNFADTKKILGVDTTAGKALIKSGLIKPLLAGGASKHEYLFRREDIHEFLRKVTNGAPTVNGSAAGLVNCLYARRAYGLPVATLVRLVIDGRLQVIQKMANSHGLPSLLLDRDSVRSVIEAMADEGDLASGLAATVLSTSNNAISRLAAARHLRSQKTGGKLVIQKSSIRKFRNRYISLAELLERAGGNRHIVTRLLAARQICPQKQLQRCAYVGFIRKRVEAILPWLQRLGSSVIEYLEQAEKPVDYHELRKILTETGLFVGARDVRDCLSYGLSQHTDKIIFLRTLGYWVRQKPYGPTGYRPNDTKEAA